MSTYTTVQGDTFDVISYKAYGGAEDFASNIIIANPDHRHTVIFSAGVELNIPPKPELSIVTNLPPWVRR